VTTAPRDPRSGEPAAPALALVVAVRPGDALGFRLAGPHVEEVAPGAETAALRRVLQDPSVGVVAVEEDVLGAVDPALVRRARARGAPVLLPFALPRRWSDAARGREYVAALIRRAIGYSIRLGGPGGAP
jgi:V/A-type H+-transporting ATPase subunit F